MSQAMPCMDLKRIRILLQFQHNNMDQNVLTWIHEHFLVVDINKEHIVVRTEPCDVVQEKWRALVFEDRAHPKYLLTQW